MSQKRVVSDAEFAEFTRPSLRLFMSADLEGSTRLKQKRGRNSSSWMADICKFYNQFLSLFDAEISRRAIDFKTEKPDCPTVWKMLGDEIIFVVKIAHQIDAKLFLGAFHRAVEVWNNDLTQGILERGELRVKGAAWTAGFPVCNTLIETPDNREDYTGPSIDAGFRLSKLASPRRFAVSADLAWLLCHTGFEKDILFEGTAELKGVADDSGYPILWIKVGDSKYTDLENELLGRLACTRDKVQNLCAAYVQEFGVPNHLPFLGENTDFNRPPDGFDRELAVVRDFLQKEIFEVKAGDESGKQPAADEREELLSKIPG